MANENQKSAEQIAADKMLAAKIEAQKAQEPAKGAPSEPEDAAPNLTRQSIEEQLVGKYMTDGKSTEEAKSMAKKRALEIIK
ncbi:MAG: hypothetical protein H0U64_13130 [Gemmatimonadaceae bacterium]|nr:hypothetical protein [Gemmatimonadaceae bacterium]